MITQRPQTYHGELGHAPLGTSGHLPTKTDYNIQYVGYVGRGASEHADTVEPDYYDAS